MTPPTRQNDETPRSGAQAEGAPDTGARDARILVVDDDPAVLDVACRILERAGYAVLRADGAEAALRLASEENGSFDLLLTDVVMPAMSGRELAEALRERSPELPVLYMSGYTEDQVILEGVRIAEVNFLGKPFSFQELVGGVEAVLTGS